MQLRLFSHRNEPLPSALYMDWLVSRMELRIFGIKWINRTWNRQNNIIYTSWLNRIKPNQIKMLAFSHSFFFHIWIQWNMIFVFFSFSWLINDDYYEMQISLPFGGIGDASTASPFVLIILSTMDLCRLVCAKVKITPISNQLIILFKYHITDWNIGLSLDL